MTGSSGGSSGGGPAGPVQGFAERNGPHPKIPCVRLKVWSPTPVSLQRCRRRFFFSTPLQWECHFFTKASRTAGTAPFLEASKLRLWLQRRAFWAQTGAVAAVWCPLSWAPTWPPSSRRLFGPNLGSSGWPFGASPQNSLGAAQSLVSHPHFSAEVSSPTFFFNTSAVGVPLFHESEPHCRHSPRF